MVDDHVLIAQGLAALMKSLEPSLAPRVAGNAQEALHLVASTSFSIAFVDARMPGLSGIELIKTLRTQYSSLKLVGMTSYAQHETITELLQAGVDGLLLKGNANADELKACLNTVLSGSMFMSAEAQHIITQNGFSPGTTPFTKREQEVLKLLVAGLSSKEIANQLNLKTATIEDYRKAMLQKTSCKNIAELSAFVYKNGLV